MQNPYHRIALLYWLTNLILVVHPQQFPNIIWSYLPQSQFSSPYIDKYLSLLQQNHRLKARGWQFRILNANSIQLYLSNIPQYQQREEDIDRMKLPSKQLKVDYVKYWLLMYYGGVWIDRLSMLVQDLFWIRLDKLRRNPDVHKSSKQPSIFLFSSPPPKTPNPSHFPNTAEPPTKFQLFFIAAQPQTPLLRTFLQKYIEMLTRAAIVWEMDTPNGTTDEDWLEYNYQFYYELSLGVLEDVIKGKMEELGSSDGTGEGNDVLSFYKLWYIPSQKGPLALAHNNYPQHITPLCLYSQYQLAALNITLRYLIHLKKSELTKLHRYRKIFISYLLKITNKIRSIPVEDAEGELCSHRYQIWNQSFFYRNILKELGRDDEFRVTGQNTLYNFQCPTLVMIARQIRQQSQATYYIVVFSLAIVVITIAMCAIFRMIQGVRAQIQENWRGRVGGTGGGQGGGLSATRVYQ